MHALGWSVLPILPHDVQRNGAGKAPALNGYNNGAFGYDKEGASQAEIQSWNAGSAARGGTGVCCNRVAAVDIDVLSSAELSTKVRILAERVFGSTPFVRTGQFPKTLLVYRRDQTVRKFAQKCASGNGDGLEIIADWHFVAYGIHPKTSHYYSWTGLAEPLNSPPEAAPLITQAQVDKFFYLVREIMDLNKTGGRRNIRSTDLEQQATRDSIGRVVSGRDRHLYYIVWRVWRRMHQAGEEITVQALADHAWEEFEATTILTGCKETYRDARAKAAWRIREEERRCPERVIAPGIPTYLDQRVPLEEAERAILRQITEFGARAAARREAAEAAKEEERKRLKKLAEEYEDGIPF